jgi:hypothetical protein
VGRGFERWGGGARERDHSICALTCRARRDSKEIRASKTMKVARYFLASARVRARVGCGMRRRGGARGEGRWEKMRPSAGYVWEGVLVAGGGWAGEGVKVSEGERTEGEDETPPDGRESRLKPASPSSPHPPL